MMLSWTKDIKQSNRPWQLFQASIVLQRTTYNVQCINCLHCSANKWQLRWQVMGLLNELRRSLFHKNYCCINILRRTKETINCDLIRYEILNHNIVVQSLNANTIRFLYTNYQLDKVFLCFFLFQFLLTANVSSRPCLNQMTVWTWCF